MDEALTKQNELDEQTEQYLQLEAQIEARVDFIKAVKGAIKNENITALVDRALSRYEETEKLHADESVTLKQEIIEATFLVHALSIWIKNVVFEAYTLDLMTDDLTKGYRELMKLDTNALVEEYEKDKESRIRAVQEQEKPLREEQSWVEIFNGVLRGDKAEDAKRKYAEYVKRQQEAYKQATARA